jgi:DNA-binding response OmpR family regulator
MSLKILLLEDDELLGETIEDMLKSEGYEVVWVTRGNDAVDITYEEKFDLYIFDIGVPDIDGLELLESLREADDTTPAIYISARIDIDSIAKGFENGAYDYIKKPFFPEELLVRIRARFNTKKSNLLQCGQYTHDLSKKILYKDNEVVSMGEVQREVLHLFITNRGRVLDKNQLLECLSQPSDAALRVAINKLKHATEFKFKNVRGVGYILEEC